MPDLGPAALAAPNPVQAAPLRVLQLGMHWFSEGSGGLDRVYHDLLTALPAQGVEVFGLVEGPANVGALTAGKIHPYADPSDRLPLARLRGARRQIGALMRRERIDLVASHFALYVAAGLDRLARKPLIMHFHGPWAEEARLEGASRAVVAAKTAIEKLAIRRANGVIVLSEAFKTLVCARHGVPAHNVRVIPGSVDLDRFAPTMPREAARQVLGWPASRPTLVAVRRLTNRMGLENLIACLQDVVRVHPDVLLQIVGKGRLADSLKRRVEESGLTRNVHFAGFLPDAMLPLAYRAADLNVVPTVALEGFGLTAAESLAAGTPSMVTPVGGLPEVVSGLSPRLVFASPMPRDLAARLIDALSAPSGLPDEASCRAYAAACFAPSLAAAHTADFYRSLL